MKLVNEQFKNQKLALSCGEVVVDEEGMVEPKSEEIFARLQALGFDIVGQVEPESKESDKSEQKNQPRFKRNK